MAIEISDVDYLRTCFSPDSRMAKLADKLERLQAENADLREELAAMRDSHRALDPVELMALDMRSGADLVITVHNEKHLEEVRQAASQYASVLQMRGLDCNIFIAPPGVEVTTRNRYIGPPPSHDPIMALGCDCDQPPTLEFEMYGGPYCFHCRRPDCLPHAEGCPASAAGGDAAPLGTPCSCCESGRHGMGIDLASGTSHTVRTVIEDRQEPDAPSAPGYCSACGGWGDHRIGCPNK